MQRCPKCQTEYRDGFSICTDCGVQLVEFTEKTRKIEKEDVDEVLLANIYDTVEFSYIVSLLQEAKIPYRIIEEDTGNYLQIMHGRSYMGKNIYISKNDYDQAQEILDSYKHEPISEDNSLDETEPNDTNPLFRLQSALIILYIIIIIIIA